MTTGFRTFNVLFVCTHNSARSILAEALLNRLGAGRFDASSAGFDPVAAVSPYVLGLLHRINYNTGRLTTKPLEAMIGKYAPAFDFIIRLSPGMPECGRWPRFAGEPVVVDWLLPDPCEILTAPALIAQAYADMFTTLVSRLDALANLPLEQLESGRIRGRLERMGEAPLRLVCNPGPCTSR